LLDEGGVQAKDQEPDALKFARPVLRGGKSVKIYLVRFDVARKSEFLKKNSWLVSKPVPARRSVWSNPGVSQLEG